MHDAAVAEKCCPAEPLPAPYLPSRSTAGTPAPVGSAPRPLARAGEQALSFASRTVRALGLGRGSVGPLRRHSLG